MNFGFTVDESSSFAVMDAAIEAGINFFDTANVYGGPQSPDMKKGYGIAEQTVGRWLQRSGHRDDIVLATKVYQPMGLGPNDRRMSAYHIRRACEASLRRLQTDHIDLYQMHHVDRATPWEEIWQAMEQLVRQGKISYVGSSNFAGWDVALAQCAASARHFMGLTSEQSLYNLAVRTVELELIPALRSLGIGLIPYSPLHAGLLAGLLGTATEGRISDDSTQQRIEANRDQLEAYEGLCRELGSVVNLWSFFKIGVGPRWAICSSVIAIRFPSIRRRALCSRTRLVRAVRDASGGTPILHAPPAAVAAVSHALGVVVRDVVLTADEICGLTAGLLVSHQPALGRVSLLEWLKENASTLGRSYANELDRHFRVRG